LYPFGEGVVPLFIVSILLAITLYCIIPGFNSFRIFFVRPLFPVHPAGDTKSLFSSDVCHKQAFKAAIITNLVDLFNIFMK